MQKDAQKYYERIKKLPDHKRKKIDIAAEQLSMLQASFNTGSMNIDLVHMQKQELLEVFDKIEAMDMEIFRSVWMFEPPFDARNPEKWLAQSRIIRIAYLTEQFELLSRLRDDEPEAWDEINELFFDD